MVSKIIPRLILTWVISSVLLVTLTACGSDKKNPRLRGERLSILTSEGDIEVDETLANFPVSLPQPYVNDNWGQPGGNTSNVLHHLALADTLTQVWKTDIGDGSKNYEKLVSGPVYWNGVLYIIDTDATVSAIDGDNGRRLWRTELEDEDEKSNVAYGGGVSYWNGRIFATTGFGFAVGLDASTGEELWRADIGVPLRGGPTVSKGNVYVHTQDNQLIALDADDGEVIWEHFAIVENAEVLGNSSPAIDGDTVIAAFSSGELYALRSANGQVSWQDALSRTGRLTALATLNDIDGHPVIYNGRVYVGNHSGRLLSIDLRSGERVWESNIGTLYTPWIAGNYMFVLNTEGELVNLSIRDGRVRWISQLQRFEKQKKRKGLIRWAGPVLAGDRLFVVSSHGYMLTVSPYTGEILSGIKLPAPAVIPPIVVNQTVYLLTDKGDLIAYR